MELVSFSVRNFRSITDAHKINFKKYNVLIGKNNEGKSNLLEALSICMNLINQPKEIQRNMLKKQKRYVKSSIYDWDRDFPILYQTRKQGLKSIFKIEFLLNDEELKEIKKLTKTRINSFNLIVKIEIGPGNIIDIKIPKKGTNSLTNKAIEIMEYISSKITYNYIPARRQEKETKEIIERNISKEFLLMNQNEEYREALDKIKKLQTEKLKKISNEIKPVLQEFIPNIKNIDINFSKFYNYNRVFDRDIEIMVDDGTLTKLEYKGDGIKSLIALAMLKNRTDDNTMSVIAVDEPEAHLHPGAMNELSKTLKKLSINNQVIISTHSQLFMNKENIKNNILVNNGKAKPAKNIHEIRELLGIKMSDNLMNSECILLVEGESDKVILNKVFCSMSEKIRKHINDGSFSLFSVGGASKIEYNLNIFNNQLCKCYVLVDNDNEGRKIIEKITGNGLIENKETHICSCKGMRESEIEDCFSYELYKEEIKNKYGVNIVVKEFKNNKKWSERMKDVFITQGQIWNEKIEKELKTIVANNIEEKFSNTDLIPEKSKTIQALIEKIEENMK